MIGAGRRGGAGRRQKVAVVLALTLALSACGSGSGSRRATTTPSTEAATRPNVVVIMTDDQTVEELRVMEQTRRLIGDVGTTFTRFYASYPLCCPSRATFFTGEYAHNHGVRDNIAPEGGFYKFDGTETLPVWLRRAGYRTIQIGKYLNQYAKFGPPTVPQGWDEWFGLIDPSTYRYFDYSVSSGGYVLHYGAKPDDYQTDVLARRAVDAIRRAAKGSRPFFLDFATLAPHETGRLNEEEGLLSLPPVPAPRDENAFAGEPLPKSPAFDEADVSDKPSFISDRAQITAPEQQAILQRYRAELASLLAVDDAVARIVDALKQAGVLDRTVVVFTSDNGLFHGEHRIQSDKTLLYEPAVRVPLLVRGPGFPAGRRVDTPVANVDLAPTILELADASPGVPLDGDPLQAAVHGGDRPRQRAVLLDNRNSGPRVQSTGVITQRYAYLEHSTEERELYDLLRDPDELDNLTGSPEEARVVSELSALLARLRRCAGPECRGLRAPRGATLP